MLNLMEKDIRILNIAGYLIKISFLKPESAKTRSNFIRMADSVFNGFLVKPTYKTIKSDFFIDIKPTANNLFLNGSKNAFVKLYDTSDNSDRITSFYSVSIDQFQLILMQVLFVLLANRGSVVHCSVINFHDQAILFLGKSGAGKSTAADLLSDEYEVLADDDGIIKTEKGKYYFYQSPNSEKNESIKKTGKRYLVKAVFLLKKSKMYKAVKIVNKEFMFKQLTHQLLGDLKKPDKKIEFLFQLVNNFASFYLLFFGKDKIRLKRLIDNELF